MAAPTAATAADELTATSTVLDRGDEDGPMLCLGLVGESYPPTCSGPQVVGWDWATVDGERAVSGVTWGDFDVVGTWDGRALTLTRPPTLAVDSAEAVDPVPPLPPADPAKAPQVDQALTDYVEGTTSDAGTLTAGEQAGRLHVTVAFDDGTLQRQADERYGSDVVVIISALKPV
ncbi:hypothetical protein [Frigoribacterium sp. PvP032]|uniref:hypothetical protein n=1 Tax=Frigoribacterium sp. PvP032 TaxID=2806589 RepID=UPI001AE2ADC1|nr:hypothetical protein [Frigoribacterium sp. PvP032]MBP1189213.1 hypothetical protein [Frigoribacterium sp. PvP032]